MAAAIAALTSSDRIGSSVLTPSLVTMPFLTLNTIESKLSILDVSSSERRAARLAFNARFASSHLYPKGVFTRSFSTATPALLEEVDDGPAALIPPPDAVDDDDAAEEEGRCGGTELGWLALS